MYITTTTETTDESAGGSQVWVFNSNGTLYQPAGLAYNAWPRYNALTGTGNDADRNGEGQHGYGCYGLNVGIGNIDDDKELEIIVTYDNHQIQAFSIMFASEPIVADLNQDGSPEVLFTTFGDPNVLDSGNLVILAADGSQLFDMALPNTSNDHNGNGNGAPAAPTVADLNGDGNLEIFIQTFEHGMDIYTVPGSAENCLLWSTARGGPLRMGQPSKI